MRFCAQSFAVPQQCALWHSVSLRSRAHRTLRAWALGSWFCLPGSGFLVLGARCDRVKRSVMRRRLLAEFVLGLCVFVAGARVAAGQTTVAANYDPLLHELSENSSLGGHGDV